MARSHIPAAKVKNTVMRISERPFACVLAIAAVCGGTSVHAFELKNGDPPPSAPGSALSALPSLPTPSLPGTVLPDLGVDKAIRDMWRGFARSYRSGDKVAALKQLEAAAEQGDILAQWKLGRMYADGDGVSQDDYRAFQLFSRIADARGDESRDSLHAGVVANAFVALGIYWLDGIPNSPVKPNASHAAKAFNYAATYYGHPEAQYQLARMLLDGAATGRQEPRLAMRWLSLAAEKGHVPAQAVLGRMLFMGEATQRQPMRGLMWLRIASENASPTRHGWVLEMHQKAHEAASEEERRLAQAQAERYLKSAERR
jgi:uncharacterized protein